MSTPSKKIVIIGGVAGGATAAARIRRLDENAEIILLERGPYVSFANCGLPYFISRDIQKRSALLLQSPEGFFSRYRVDVKLNTEAIRIEKSEKYVLARGPEGEVKIGYDKLVLAQGGQPFMPPISGMNQEHVFKIWTVPDMDRIHAFIDEKKPRQVVVAGGGFIGIEMAEAFRARGLEVDLVELAPQVMITMDTEFGAMIQSALEKGGVRVHTGMAIEEVSAESVKLSNGKSLSAQMVLFSIGVRPELTLAKSAGLEIGASGGLLVDEELRSSDPHIYAAGDMIEVTNKILKKKVRIPLAGPANRQGRIVGTNVLGGHAKYNGALGTSVVKVFESAAASTGLTEKLARESGFSVGVAYTFKDHHAGYYPGAKNLALKLVYDLNTGRLLGGQAFGEEGVEKRIDVLATALHGKMTLEDLAEIDLAYAPPFSSANDPVNMTAFVGLNHIQGYSTLKTPLEAWVELKSGGVILDVRTRGEQAKAPIENVISIPADEVRDTLDDIPRDQNIYILSKDGFLGHTTQQILKGSGFKNVFTIAGGFAAIRWFKEWQNNK